MLTATEGPLALAESFAMAVEAARATVSVKQHNQEFIKEEIVRFLGPQHDCFVFFWQDVRVADSMPFSKSKTKRMSTLDLFYDRVERKIVTHLPAFFYSADVNKILMCLHESTDKGHRDFKAAVHISVLASTRQASA